MTLIAATKPLPASMARHAAQAAEGPRTSVRTTVAVPLASAWESFVPVKLADVFPDSKGPVPAVRSTSGQQGRWDVVGRSRSVHLSDGSTVREEITASDPTAGSPPVGNAASFSYRVSGFTGPIGLLAKEAHGAWRFEQVAPNRTRIEWIYSLGPKSWLTSVPLRFILATFWHSYMRDGIQNLKVIAERRSR